MPTRKEVSKIKADWIEKREEAIGTRIETLQQELFDEIIADFLLLAKERKLTQTEINKLEFKVRKGMREKFPQVMRETIRSSRAVGDLNLMYFSTLMESDQLDIIQEKTLKNINKRLGIDADGKIIQGGFTDKTLASDRVQKKFVKEVKSIIKSNVDVQTAQQQLKKIFTGSSTSNGLISQYYNTFAKDILLSIDRSNSAVYATELGLKNAYYEGGLIKTSRSFCLEKNGKIFHMDQIMKWKDSKFIKDMYDGKIDEYDPINGPPGGFGCLHNLGWITAELAEGKAEQNRIAKTRNKAFKERHDL